MKWELGQHSEKKVVVVVVYLLCGNESKQLICMNVDYIYRIAIVLYGRILANQEKSIANENVCWIEAPQSIGYNRLRYLYVKWNGKKLDWNRDIYCILLDSAFYQFVTLLVVRDFKIAIRWSGEKWKEKKKTSANTLSRTTRMSVMMSSKIPNSIVSWHLLNVILTFVKC